MSQPVSETLRRAEQLRREFDQSFARPPRQLLEAAQDFLEIQVGNDIYALRLDQLSGVIADQRIVLLPSPVKSFLGVAGVRGSIVPVYSLRALLGYPALESMPRWVALLGKDRPVGVAFELTRGHLRVPSGEIVPASGDPSRRALGHDAIRRGDSTIPILNTEHLLQEIQRTAR